VRYRRPLRILDPAPAYALWAPTYEPSAHNPLMTAEQAAVERLLAGVPATSALDVGTGSGRYLDTLERAGARRIVGLDFSLPMLAFNVSRRPLVCGAAERLPLADGVFDLVLSSLTVGHIGDLQGWLAEVARVLADGGRLIYSDVHPSWEDAGWLRTFQTIDGRLYAVRQHWRSIEQHTAAMIRAGFDVCDRADVVLPPRGDRALRRWRRRWGATPVAVVFSARRRARAGPPDEPTHESGRHDERPARAHPC
jgi:malonyl-CoA O-methyltransferase